MENNNVSASVRGRDKEFENISLDIPDSYASGRGRRRDSLEDDPPDNFENIIDEVVDTAIDVVDEVIDVPDGKETQKQANTYAAKKTVAQGMMDIALITANANQLRYIIEFNSHSSTFYFNVILIAISLMLQVAVGVSLIFKGRLDLRGQSKHRNARKINNYVVVAVFLVTIINVFIASFTITSRNNNAVPM